MAVGLPGSTCQTGVVVEPEMIWRLADSAIEAGDFARAKALYERGAALGDAACWHGLGYMFDVGQGLAADKQQAMRCYKMAWRRLNTSAACNIAILYKERGNRKAMFSWFKRAADLGDIGAYLELAKCYLDGAGAPKSADAAVRCLAKVVATPSVADAELEEALELLAKFRLHPI